MVPTASRVIMEPTTLQIASVFEPLSLASRCASQRVRGLTRLRDHEP